ncbi:MAG: hypothetical protein R3C29_13485 [Dehalococcoidia bacterium]|nr:hypothetical protein [Dehalococcoidia bacterium]
MSAASTGGYQPTDLKESIFRAATSLQHALESDKTSPTWRPSLRSALGQCVLAVEQHVVALVAPEGIEHEIAEREPRLVPALEHLAVALSELMIHLWQTREEAGHPGPLLMHRLERLVDEMRDVATEEFNLVIESFNQTGTGD